MPKRSKIQTPDWILKGKKAPKKKNTGRIFKIRSCPKCGSSDVGVEITGEECKGGKCNWECRKCKWKGQNIKEEELSEEEFLKRSESGGK
jgi:hypothetical protein